MIYSEEKRQVAIVDKYIFTCHNSTTTATVSLDINTQQCKIRYDMNRSLFYTQMTIFVMILFKQAVDDEDTVLLDLVLF